MPNRPDIETLPVNPETCSVLSCRVKATSPTWRGLDFSRAVIRTQATALIAMLGRDEAPYDLHLDVPFCHPDDETDPSMLIRLTPNRTKC